MSGYLDRPGLTARTIVDGWLHTGDLGFIDERGYLFIRGRLREVINSGGFKVFPGDVEAALARHPAVAECACSAWRIRSGARRLMRRWFSRPGCRDGDEFIAFVKAELDSVKAPKAIHFVDELPRNAAGKVSRADVRRKVERASSAV